MSKVQVLTLWIIAALLGVAVIAVKVTQKQGPATCRHRHRPRELLADFPAREVTTVTIGPRRQSVTVREDGDTWIVEERDNYPANTQMLGDFLTTLVELKAAQGLEAGATYDNRFGMDATARSESEHGLHVTFRGADGKELGHRPGQDTDAGAPIRSIDDGGRTVRTLRRASTPTPTASMSSTRPFLALPPTRRTGSTRISSRSRTSSASRLRHR